MPIILYGYRRNIIGQGCACGLDCFLNRRPRPKNSADRTVSYRHRAGSRRNKKVAQSSAETAWTLKERRGY
jgi:hypothetical protein